MSEKPTTDRGGGRLDRLVSHWKRRRRMATLNAFERELNTIMIQAAQAGDWSTHSIAGKIKEYDLHDLKSFLG